LKTLRFIFVFALLVGASARASFAEPPSPPAGTDVRPMTTSTRSIHPGGTVDVTAEGCDAGAAIKLDLYNPELVASDEATAGDDGSFAVTLLIPEDSTVGRAWIRASCRDGDTDAIFEAIVLVNRPRLVITWINVLFGLGAFFLVMGFGLVVRRKPTHKKPSLHRR
jgi:hypothetical protein